VILENPSKVFATGFFKLLHVEESEVQLSLAKVVAKAYQDHDVVTNSGYLLRAVGQNNNWVWKAIIEDEKLGNQTLSALVLSARTILTVGEPSLK
jgi:hypothetical protein